MRSLRIGIDARELCGHSTGVGRYLGGLLREWQESGAAQQHEFILYTAEPLPLPSDPLKTRIVAGPPGTWWEQVRLPRAVAADAIDVFFAPAYTAALRLRTPTVVAIHDISFMAHPEWFTVREGLRRRWLTTQSAARARTIITISEFSRREIVEHLNIAPSRVVVIPPGIATDEASATARSGGILYVGSIFNRRRVPDLIHAFAPIARAYPSVTLDLVGDNRSHPHQDIRGLIAREGLDEQARWRAYVPDEGLRALYHNARAFAFLSEYEGLGLTPLEALAAGVPPVLLDTPVARESCGSAALYVQPGRIAELTEALLALLFDEGTRSRVLSVAPRVLARYAWRDAARDTLAAIVAAVDEPTTPGAHR